jgi:hypothetical protein
MNHVAPYPDPCGAGHKEETSGHPDGYEDFDESPPDISEDCGCEDDGACLPDGF